MTPDIQELKKTTQDLQGPNVINMVVPSSTILALIEENEGLKEAITDAAIGKGICHGADHWRNALVALHTDLSTALEGVKK